MAAKRKPNEETVAELFPPQGQWTERDYFSLPDTNRFLELSSPATRETDRGEKFFEYAKAGVHEYWLVDPEKRTIEVYALHGHVYEPVALSRERACSKLLEGFCVSPEEIF
jgi:hypothetical protein